NLPAVAINHILQGVPLGFLVSALELASMDRGFRLLNSQLGIGETAKRFINGRHPVDPHFGTVHCASFSFAFLDTRHFLLSPKFSSSQVSQNMIVILASYGF